MSGSTPLPSPRPLRVQALLRRSSSLCLKDGQAYCSEGFSRSRTGMDDDKFWAIVEGCHAASGGDMDRMDQLIKVAISSMSSEDALAFYQIFQRMMDTAFTWPLWGAAYVLNGGCGDDSFSDFR